VVQPTGPSQLEPPLKELADTALSAGTSQIRRFHQGSSDHLLYARAIPDTNRVVIVAASLDEARQGAFALRRNIALTALGVVVAASAAGFWLAGRSLRPARQLLIQQRNFIADAAHEMRTPLAVIQASASGALARPRASEEYVRSLAEIRAAAERASTGVGELLDLARLEAGQAVPRRGPLRLDLLVEEIAASVSVESCEVEARPADPVIVDADLALLRQAVDNVVRNAAHRADHVTLATMVDGSHAVVEVADDGPGLPESLIDHAFDRFRSDTAGGVGLGLAIVRRILELHGGSAEIVNRPEGGAAVRLRLPLSRR
jgi:signal transduction histidine kinase